MTTLIYCLGGSASIVLLVYLAAKVRAFRKRNEKWTAEEILRREG